MEIKPIEKIPVESFTAESEEDLIDNLSPGEKKIYRAIIALRKEVRWSSETARSSYNMGAENTNQIENWRRRYESPLGMVIGLLGVILAAAIGAAVQRWLGSGK
jgi:hypothetical protein